MIGEVFALTNSHKWFRVLPDLIANYNARPDRGLAAVCVGVAPADVG
jgi:hypothetical protein